MDSFSWDDRDLTARGLGELSDDLWRQLILSVDRDGFPVYSAETVVEYLKTWSQPCVLTADNGEDYVVKMMRDRQTAMISSLFVEQIAGRIGLVIDAPVPQVELILISPDFISVNPPLSTVISGYAHGSLYNDKVSGRLALCNISDPANRSRFALLSVFYSLIALSDDYQFFYRTVPPPWVYSFDHGGALAKREREWNSGNLGIQPTAAPDDKIKTECMLTYEEVGIACRNLYKLTNDMIALCVAAPPNDWGIGINDRIIIARFIAQRRNDLLLYAL